MNRINYLSIIIIFITINLSITLAFSMDSAITKSKAVEIGNNEIENLGLDINYYHVKAKKYNTPWNEYIPKDSIEYSSERNKLNNKVYWAVYYYHPTVMNIKGGDICIFIDSNTGKVIDTVRWR